MLANQSRREEVKRGLDCGDKLWPSVLGQLGMAQFIPSMVTQALAVLFAKEKLELQSTMFALFVAYGYMLVLVLAIIVACVREYDIPQWYDSGSALSPRPPDLLVCHYGWIDRWHCCIVVCSAVPRQLKKGANGTIGTRGMRGCRGSSRPQDQGRARQGGGQEEGKPKELMPMLRHTSAAEEGAA
jgi:hypothetical protein